MTDQTQAENSREERILVTRGHLEVLVRHALFRGALERNNAMTDIHDLGRRIVDEFLIEASGSAAGKQER